MPQLLVREVPQDVVEALKRRAAEHGRSADSLWPAPILADNHESAQIELVE